MLKRTITGIVIMVVLLTLVCIEQLLIPFQIIMFLCAIIACNELLKMFETKKKLGKYFKVVITLNTLLVYISCMLFFGDTSLDSTIPFGLLILSIMNNLLMLVLGKDFDADDAAKSIFTSFYVGIGIASFVSLRLIGIRFIVFLMIATMLTDVFAYFYGVKFGKHKMAPDISPKKSWEGAIGGTVVGTVTASVFALMYGNLFGGDHQTMFDIFSTISEHNYWILCLVTVVVAFMCSIFGQIGDLIASKIKRTYNIKDFGNIFPGHGGFLDRFDSSIYVSMFLMVAIIVIKVIFPLI